MIKIKGAASAYNHSTVSLTLNLLNSNPEAVPFNTAGEQFGTVARTNATTFTLNSAGTYEVYYRLNIGVTTFGGAVGVYVNDVLRGPGNSVPLSAASTASDTVLISANAGDTVKIQYDPAIAGLGLAIGDTSTLVIEQLS